MTKQLHMLSLLLITLLIFLNLFNTNRARFIFILIIIILLSIELIKKNDSIKYNRNTVIIIMFFLFWLIYGLVQLPNVMDLSLGLRHIRVMLTGIILIIFVSLLVNSKPKIQLFYFVWGISLLITIFVGWFELVSGINIGGRPPRLVNETRVVVNHYNPNNFSFFLTINLPIILYWIKDKKFIIKILGFFMYISSFYFISVNESRLNILLFIIITILFLAYQLREKKKVFIFFTFIIALGILINIDLILATFEQIQTLDSSDQSLNERKVLMSWGIQAAFNNPLGVGPGQIIYHMPVVGSNIHHFWIEILVNFGLIIFLGLVLFFVFFLYKSIKIKKDKELISLIMPVLWIVILFIPASTGPSTIFEMGLIWFVFAVMLSTINVISKAN